MLSDTESYNIENQLAIWISFVRRYVLSQMIFRVVARMAISLLAQRIMESCQVCRLMINSYCRLPIFGRMATFSLTHHDSREVPF